jgi:ornithine cyclodeaminase
MKILTLTHAQVEELLPMDECIEVMERALIDLAEQRMHQPLRMVVRPPDAKGLMALMPAYMGGEHAAYGLKAVCAFPENVKLGKDAHQGGVMLFSAETGELLALMNASAITAIRTAAVSGVATKLLAREDATDVAIIGSGVQAHTHLLAMALVRPVKRVRVAGLDFEKARRFAEQYERRFAFSIDPVETVEQAVDGAHVIVTVTSAREPILKREWVAPGTHINAVGSSIPTTREIDSATMAEASLFVDRRESTVNESGDYLMALKDGAITGPEHIQGEIGEILIGANKGRESDDEITLFKSLGLAVEDLASAEYLYRKAMMNQMGTWVEF